MLTAGANRVIVFNRLAIQGVPTRLVLPARARGLDEFGVFDCFYEQPKFPVGCSVAAFGMQFDLSPVVEPDTNGDKEEYRRHGRDFHSSQ